ncbi:MAG: hypothetical protein DHS20C16_22030 [Phycisphaerae bacterium]|nr:MAG: hypothetical protein DHS20C16_22030 [Phycisphaerae bacterium]
MAKYLFIYRGNAEDQCPNKSPEEMQAVMAKWGAWFETVGAGMVSGGDALLPTGKIVRGNTVTDGPFIEAKELVGGYSIVQGDSYDAAVAYAKTCPIIEEGGAVEVRELAGFDQEG